MRYGTAKYSTFKYGTAPTTNNLLWGIQVDWNDDNYSSSGNEAEHAFNLKTSRGRDYLLTAGANGFEPMPVGEATVSVHNDTGRYDPYNAGGPLYGKLKPGKAARIFVKNGNTGSTYTLFTGVLTNIIPFGRRGTADLVLSDGWEYLTQVDVEISAITSIRLSDSINYILDAANWNSHWPRSIAYCWDILSVWWEDRGKARDKLLELTKAAVGNLVIKANGTFVFYDRYYAGSPALTITEDIVLKDISIPQPWENYRNIVTVTAHPLNIQPLQTIWQLQETPWIDASGGTYEIEIRYSGDGPAFGVLYPVPGTDYYGYTLKEGVGGNNLNLSVAFTNYGTYGRLVFTNNSAYGGFIRFAQVRGHPLVSYGAISKTATAADAAINPRDFSIDATWLQDERAAESIAWFLVSFLSQQQHYPQVLFEDRVPDQFVLDLADVAHIDLDTMGIDGNYTVGKIEHEWLNETGQAVRTSMKFEPIIDSGAPYWTLDVSELDTTTKLGW